jgi:lipid-binding SYLF domain-containing protein
MRTLQSTILGTLTSATLAILILVSNVGNTAPRQDATLLDATQVLGELRSAPDQNVPNWLLERAYAVAVLPNVIKAGLIAGGRRGSGVMALRQPDGSWSNPIFINITGGSLGLQWGVQSTDLMLVFTSKASVEGLVGGKVTLGADASVAAGPVGRQTAAATDIGLTAQVYSYSRNKGLFIGIALDGSALTIDNKANTDFYNKPGILASEITAADTTHRHESANAFIAALGGNSAPQTIAKPAAATVVGPAADVDADAGNQVSGLVTYPMEDKNVGAEPPE